MNDKPYIPLGRLREIYEMARANYHNWGSVSVAFRNYVQDEVQQLMIAGLKARVVELEAQLAIAKQQRDCRHNELLFLRDTINRSIEFVIDVDLRVTE